MARGIVNPTTGEVTYTAGLVNDAEIQEQIAGIEAVIPSGASADNKLVASDNVYTTFSGDLNDLTERGHHSYNARPSDITANAPSVSYTALRYYIDVWSDTANIYQIVRIVGVSYSPVANYEDTFIRSAYYSGTATVWGAWRRIIDTSDLTSTVTSGSNAPITSGGIWTYNGVHRGTLPTGKTLSITTVPLYYTSVIGAMQVQNTGHFGIYAVKQGGSSAWMVYHETIGTDGAVKRTAVTSLGTAITVPASTAELKFTNNGTENESWWFIGAISNITVS